MQALISDSAVSDLAMMVPALFPFEVVSQICSNHQHSLTLIFVLLIVVVFVVNTIV